MTEPASQTDPCDDWVYTLDDVRIRRSSAESGFDLVVSRLRVARGELVALIGPSGCGKSTLLDLLSLVSVPDRAGRFLFSPGAGTDIDVGGLLAAGRGNHLARLRRDGIGYVLQTGGLLPFLSVRRNIGISRALRGQAAEPAVRAAAEALGVAGHLGKLPTALSVGERQRVAIARALAHRPAVVLADEPTAALDPANAALVMERFVHLAREAGTTVVVASHDRGRVEALGFRCVSPDLAASGTRVTATFGDHR